MEYGLRRYEAVQRLRWFLFFLVCLALAYSMAGTYDISPPARFLAASSLKVNDLKSVGFWSRLSWISVEPFGWFLLYVTWVAWLFVLGRFAWLLVQYGGKLYVQDLLSRYIKKPSGSHHSGVMSSMSNHALLFPTELLLQRIRPIHCQLIFHPFRRVHLMLTDSQGNFSSEDLVEKERRVAEADWQILWGSWSPFQWLLWLLPTLALAQAVWLVYAQMQPALSGQREVQDLLKPAFASVLPLVQAIALCIFFNLAAGLLKRFENLYLSNVDALIYDQFLSRLPFQSSDTLIILETLQRQFKEMHSALRRLERSVGVDKEPPGKPS